METSLQSNAVIRKRVKFTFSQLVIFLLLTGVPFAASSNAQAILDKQLTLHIKNGSLKEVLRKIESIAEVKFAYTREAVSSVDRISISADDQRLSDVLDKLLKPLNLNYQVIGRQIILCQNICINENDALQKSEIVGKSISRKGRPSGIPFCPQGEREGGA